MRGMNRVTLVGNTGRVPEIKVLEDGTMVASFSFATTEVYRRKDGESQSDTQWHSVVLWRSLAELAKKYIRKGSLLLVEGKILYRSYEDREGIKRKVTEIIADRVIMLDSKPVFKEESVPGATEDPLPF